MYSLELKICLYLKKSYRYYIILPLLPSLSSGCPATPVFRDNVDVGVVSLVLCLQAGQVGRRGHAPADSNFAQTLEPMSGSHCHKKINSNVGECLGGLM